MIIYVILIFGRVDDNFTLFKSRINLGSYIFFQQMNLEDDEILKLKEFLIYTYDHLDSQF